MKPEPIIAKVTEINTQYIVFLFKNQYDQQSWYTVYNNDPNHTFEEIGLMFGHWFYAKDADVHYPVLADYYKLTLVR